MKRAPPWLPEARGPGRLLLLLRFGRALLLVAAVALFRTLLQLRATATRALGRKRG